MRLRRAKPHPWKLRRPPVVGAPPAVPPVMGALSVSSRTTSAVTVGWSAATSGSGTKNYALYRHTSAPFTPPGTGTLVGTTTGTSQADASPGSGDVYYRVVVTDDNGTDASEQSADQGALVTRVKKAAVVLGLVGDSITANMGSAANLLAAFSAIEPRRAVTLGSNQAVGGTPSYQWVPGFGSGYSEGAAIAFAAANVTLIPIMLGTNDAKPAIATSAASYAANIAAIAAYMVANVPGATVILNAPPYVVPPGALGAWDEASNVLLAAYRDSLAAIDNGTTIRLGDVDSFDAFLDNAGSYLSDGVHPNGTGELELQKLWAGAYERTLVAAGGGGGSGPVPMIGSTLIRSLQ